MGQKTTIHLIEGGTQVIDTRDLADAQNEAAIRVDAAFDMLVAAGRNYGGVNYQIDDASRANIAGAATMAVVAQSAGGWPDDFYWIATNNSHTSLTAAQMIGFGMDIGSYYTALILTKRALKDAIASLATIAACDEFDVTQDWPIN